MLISESTQIDKSSEIVWNHLKTLQDAEKYIPVVSKSFVIGSGIGTTRTCDIEMGEQKFQIKETLVEFDESGKSLTIQINDAPPPMMNLLIDFFVKGNNEHSKILVSTESENSQENTETIKGILSMICNGLKQFHEGNS